MTDGPSEKLSDQSYAMSVADSSFEWYCNRAIRCRRAHRLSETMFVTVSAAIPVAAVLAPRNPAFPVVLGAILVIMTGLRSVFHWHDNFLRFSAAREAVETQRRLFFTGVDPYSDPATRDQALVMAVSQIEREEMGSWAQIAQSGRAPARQ